MREAAKRRRARLIGAGAITLTASLVLSGCTLIQELQTPDEQQTNEEENDGGSEGAVGIPESVAPGGEDFYEQGIEWGECPEEYAAVDDTAECAYVDAPLNWAEPGSDDPIELALVKLPATSGNSQGALFTNPGGPGAGGVDFVAQSGDYMFSSDLRENFDIVGWDPRGVGYSSAVYCVDDAGMDDYLYGVPDGYADMTEDELLAYQQAKAAAFGDSCYENTGPLLEYVDTKSTVQDLDMLRYVVGEGSALNYFGFSYGTDIGAQYIDMFPEQVGRVVLDGATDPTVPMFDVILDQQEKFSDSIRAYLEDCLTSAECPFDQAGGVDGAIDEISDIMNDVDETTPRAADGRVFTSSVIYQAIVAGMYDETSWQYVTQAFVQWERNKDSSIFFSLTDSYNGRDPSGTYYSNQEEAFTAINCLDYPLVTDKATIKAFNQKLQDVTLFQAPMTEAQLEVGDVTCENWPVQSRVTEQEPVVGAGAAPVLVVATTNDPATPLKWAEAVAEQLESASLLVYEGEGHIAYDEGSECVIGTVDDYLITGNLPEGDINC
ncbi:alpha/beta hydrolase [Gulosibacter sediminis]|uniref:alpha/beta hydrolase n=1 Tax=Gulosibacter sediminis TaxID=1729695 RepID=UPI0024ACE06D|nr:alpha/beta hydrolase [Gulosibacter sediminis]